jgi:thiol:disulfide interchange protein
MKKKLLTFLLLFAALNEFSASVQAQSTVSKPYTYMQIFFNGPAVSSGFAFMSFSPAFHNQTDVKLDEPSIVDTVIGPSSTSTTQTDKNQLIEVRSVDTQDPKYKAEAKERREKYRQQVEKQLKARDDRSQKMRTTLTKALNDAAAEGWEVVQMSAYGDNGLAYLLRRAK